MRGLNPVYLERLDEAQSKWAITGPGKMFLDTFVHVRGNHCFVIGTTNGTGKRRKYLQPYGELGKGRKKG
jgi:hypothetical protein